MQVDQDVATVYLGDGRVLEGTRTHLSIRDGTVLRGVAKPTPWEWLLDGKRIDQDEAERLIEGQVCRR